MATAIIGSSSTGKSTHQILTAQATNEEHRDRRFLVRKPVALQYFHNGVLVKSSEKERVAGKFELFFDLLYVALIANFAEHVAEHPSGATILQFILVFTPAWHVWADEKENANNYHNDDIIQRFSILWIMALLILFGNNANYVADDINAMRITVAAYQIIRLTQVSLFAYYSLASHYHRTQNRFYCLAVIIDILLWVPLYFESVSLRAKIAVAFVAIVFEEFGYILTFGPWISRWLKLEFSTAVDIDHETDRYTAFTVIILGEFLYAIVVGSPAHGGLNMSYMNAVWTLVIAFVLNSMYVYKDGAYNSIHPVRHSVFSCLAWMMLHLPLSAALMLGGHASATSTYHHMDQPTRWLWGGGLGLGFVLMYALALVYKDGDDKGFLLMPKWLRILPRLLVGIIFVLLPLAHEKSLSDSALLGTGAALSMFAATWEIVGSLEACAWIFEPWGSDDMLQRSDPLSSDDMQA